MDCVYESIRRRPTRSIYANDASRKNQIRRKADYEWSKAIRKRDGNQCKRCGQQPNIVHAHHIASRRQRPDLRHDLSNGVTLCNPCHMWVHNHPLEAETAGFMSFAKYELAIQQKWIQGMKRANQARKNGQNITCTNCGKSKYYAACHLKLISPTAYRCNECYRSIKYNRVNGHNIIPNRSR